MQRAVQVPNALIGAILGLVVLFVVGSALWSQRWSARRQMDIIRNQEEQA
jgi:Tfp pilus assembly protein PilW